MTRCEALTELLGEYQSKAKSAPMLLQRKITRLIHEGRYAAEVEIEIHCRDESRSPTMSVPDAKRLETTRLALRRGDLAAATKFGRVFELTPVAAE